MAMLRKAVFATAMISTGLLSGTGMALAGGQHGADTHGTGTHGTHGDGTTKSHNDGATYQNGLINSGDIKPNTNPALCNNQIPVNILGVQIPLQDAAASLGLLNHSDDAAGSPSNVKTCSNPAAS